MKNAELNLFSLAAASEDDFLFFLRGSNQNETEGFAQKMRIKNRGEGNLNLENQRFGIEIEMTGITRKKASEIAV